MPATSSGRPGRRREGEGRRKRLADALFLRVSSRPSSSRNATPNRQASDNTPCPTSKLAHHRKRTRRMDSRDLRRARQPRSGLLRGRARSSNPAPVLPGGQLMLTTEVENYPGFPDGVTGPEMMQMFQKQAERFGTRVVGTGHRLKCDFSQRPFALKTSSGETVQRRGGDHRDRRDGELARARERAPARDSRAAASAPARSATARCRSSEISRSAVVGGGDTAMEEARLPRQVRVHRHIMHRRDEFRASKTMQERVLGLPTTSRSHVEQDGRRRPR